MKVTEEELLLLEKFNSTQKQFPGDKTINSLFLKTVNEFPDNVALEYNDVILTYAELNVLSNQFAHFLIQEYQVAAGDFVGLMLERSEYLLVAVLGILKVGCAYVPIDIEAPLTRREFIEKDSRCAITIDPANLRQFIREKKEYSVLTPKCPVNPKDLAYVIYTSGTTGTPKGVMIEHRSVVNLVKSLTATFKIDETDRTLLFSNYFFDASVEQTFLALLNGGSLIVANKRDINNHNVPSLLEKHRITHLNATPSYLEMLPDLSHLTDLRLIVTGGEVCSIQLAKRLATYSRLYNTYGPTENTVTSTVFEYSNENEESQTFSIGSPIANVRAYVVSKDLNILPIGEIGELCLAGIGVARGYLNRKALTAEKFISNPFEPKGQLYRTGDLVRWNRNGTLEFIGRKDDQVKIRGYRIELGEIEAALNSIKGVQKTVVVASTHFGKEPRLVAYLSATHGKNDSSRVEKILSSQLPAYMLPFTYIWVDHFILTPNGKIDKKSLPKPEYQRPGTVPIYRKPHTPLEKEITPIWQEILGIPKIGVDDNFFDLGGNSLLIQKLANTLEQRLNGKVSVTKIYQNPTIAELSQSMQNENGKPFPFSKTVSKHKTPGKDVAIIGMAGRFPGADSIEALWSVLEKGQETISFFSLEELDHSIPKSLRENALYVGARGIVPSAKTFDARFFGISPKLAEAMDPQQRLFLEITWELLEQSGYLPKHYDGTIGVYAGAGGNTYYHKNVLNNQELLNQVGEFQANTVNDKDYIATRTAYHLNLKGPAVNIYSACSTSLLAITEAVASIRREDCDVAIAGAASVTSPMHSGHLYQEGAMLSSDGHCKPFDAAGTGTVFSDGAGVILLKNLEKAKRDEDTIYGVIKGVGVNNDGGEKGSFTAPSVQGQAGAIQTALLDSGFGPEEITYIEAHGTATPLGDPIEMEGLHAVFGKKTKAKHCAIGSIKSNMGHLTAAAGIAGLIKTVLAMGHNKIPASLGFTSANPAIDFSHSPFYVNHELTEWKVKGTKKAGVSSFGVGGTNVHVVLEEFKANNPKVPKQTNRPFQILTWSAKTENSLNAYQEELGNFIKASNDITLQDLAFSLNTTRDVFQNRRFIISNDKNDLTQSLLSKENPAIKSRTVKVIPNELAFLFPGQGSQYLEMGKALYEHEPVFKDAIDRCAEFLQKVFEFDIREVIYPKTIDDIAQNKIKDTRFTQPALFTMEYALAQLWLSWGIKPTMMCGHSIGEFVAGHLCGIFSLEDALKLIALRGQLIGNLPGGSMLTVRKSLDELTTVLPESISIAAINADELCVVSGTKEDIKAFAQQLKERKIACMLVATSHAFHSNMMDPILETFKNEVKKIRLNVPRIPIVSSVTGHWLSDTQATDPDYWTKQLRAPVRFSEALESILSQEDTVLLEVGPGRVLTGLAKQRKSMKPLASIASLPGPKENGGAYHTVLAALGELWSHGLDLNWKKIYGSNAKPTLRLPSYVFDRKPCWANPPNEAPNHEFTSMGIQNDLQQANINFSSATDNHAPMRKTKISNEIAEIISNTSGIDIEPLEHGLTFFELGLDSLVLTQMAITLKNRFTLPITFRQLNNEYSSPELLAQFLDENLASDFFGSEEIGPNPPMTALNGNGIYPNSEVNGEVFHTQPIRGLHNLNGNKHSTLERIAQQVQLLGQQISLLQGNTQIHENSNLTPTARQHKQSVFNPKVNESIELSDAEKKELKKPFGASPKIDKQRTELSKIQNSYLEELIKSYNKRTAASKAYTQNNRAHMADPRVVSGFKPLTKELVYPIVINRSSGNRLWDLDGNEYIDTLNGFGSCFFGHQPDFIREALHHQVESGFEVGPQHPLAGEVSKLLCEFTGHERAGLCNTGSEAVLGAMRIARTVTGRSLIIAFKGSYHGINDEALVRGSKKLRTFPAAAGVLPSAVQNVLVLEYGTQESLEIIKNKAHEIAAVLVEPVQSRRPDFQPVAFLKELRTITKASETVLIFDEIITGFRMHPGGTQAMFGIRADIATYGKVIGGGVSIGAILGDKRYMDALDGGFWKYGDDSFPEVGVTYFAGTFVRHPLALASAKASLLHMKEKGAALQARLNKMTKNFVTDLNNELQLRELPLKITYFGSMWRIEFTKELPYSELLFVLMRSKGIHIWDGFSSFLTEAYENKDLDQIKTVLLSSLEELVETGFISVTALNAVSKPKADVFLKSIDNTTPPIPGAKLGMDSDGNPAWYIENKQKKGDYLKISI
ncbi:MAG: amino acid adenylation domain-containing protein [Bacteroidota bacterium]